MHACGFDGCGLEFDEYKELQSHVPRAHFTRILLSLVDGGPVFQIKRSAGGLFKCLPSCDYANESPWSLRSHARHCTDVAEAARAGSLPWAVVEHPKMVKGKLYQPGTREGIDSHGRSRPAELYLPPSLVSHTMTPSDPGPSSYSHLPPGQPSASSPQAGLTTSRVEAAPTPLSQHATVPKPEPSKGRRRPSKGKPLPGKAGKQYFCWEPGCALQFDSVKRQLNHRRLEHWQVFHLQLNERVYAIPRAASGKFECAGEDCAWSSPNCYSFKAHVSCCVKLRKTSEAGPLPWQIVPGTFQRDGKLAQPCAGSRSGNHLRNQTIRAAKAKEFALTVADGIRPPTTVPSDIAQYLVDEDSDDLSSVGDEFESGDNDDDDESYDEGDEEDDPGDDEMMPPSRPGPSRSSGSVVAFSASASPRDRSSSPDLPLALQAEIAARLPLSKKRKSGDLPSRPLEFKKRNSTPAPLTSSPGRFDLQPSPATAVPVEAGPAPQPTAAPAAALPPISRVASSSTGRPPTMIDPRDVIVLSSGSETEDVVARPSSAHAPIRTVPPAPSAAAPASSITRSAALLDTGSRSAAPTARDDLSSRGGRILQEWTPGAASSSDNLSGLPRSTSRFSAPTIATPGCSPAGVFSSHDQPGHNATTGSSVRAPALDSSSYNVGAAHTSSPHGAPLAAASATQSYAPASAFIPNQPPASSGMPGWSLTAPEKRPASYMGDWSSSTPADGTTFKRQRQDEERRAAAERAYSAPRPGPTGPGWGLPAGSAWSIRQPYSPAAASSSAMPPRAHASQPARPSAGFHAPSSYDRPATQQVQQPPAGPFRVWRPLDPRRPPPAPQSNAYAPPPASGSGWGNSSSSSWGR